MVPYNMTTANIVFFANGRPYSLGADHPNFRTVQEKLLDGCDDLVELIRLADIPTAINRASHGTITVVGNTVAYRGEELHNIWTDKLLAFMDAELPFSPVLKALDSLMKNPSMRARNRLPLFVEKNKLGFLADGRIVGLKAVRNDYMDKHSGTVVNKPGIPITPMERYDIDDDPSTHCSKGYHVGSWDYVANFGRRDDRYLLCAFWPENVVAVPNDMTTKVRLTHYEILQELQRSEIDAFISQNHTVVVTDTGTSDDDGDGYRPSDDGDI